MPRNTRARARVNGGGLRIGPLNDPMAAWLEYTD